MTNLPSSESARFDSETGPEVSNEELESLLEKAEISKTVKDKIIEDINRADPRATPKAKVWLKRRLEALITATIPSMKRDYKSTLRNDWNLNRYIY